MKRRGIMYISVTGRQSTFADYLSPGCVGKQKLNHSEVKTKKQEYVKAITSALEQLNGDVVSSRSGGYGTLNSAADDLGAEDSNGKIGIVLINNDKPLTLKALRKAIKFLQKNINAGSSVPLKKYDESLGTDVKNILDNKELVNNLTFICTHRNTWFNDRKWGNYPGHINYTTHAEELIKWIDEKLAFFTTEENRRRHVNATPATQILSSDSGPLATGAGSRSQSASITPADTPKIPVVDIDNGKYFVRSDGGDPVVIGEKYTGKVNFYNLDGSEFSNVPGICDLTVSNGECALVVTGSADRAVIVCKKSVTSSQSNMSFGSATTATPTALQRSFPSVPAKPELTVASFNANLSEAKRSAKAKLDGLLKGNKVLCQQVCDEVDFAFGKLGEHIKITLKLDQKCTFEQDSTYAISHTKNSIKMSHKIIIYQKESNEFIIRLYLTSVEKTAINTDKEAIQFTLDESGSLVDVKTVQRKRTPHSASPDRRK